MRKFKWDNPMVPKYLKKAKQSAGSPASAELNRAKKNITRQAMLAGLTVVLTIVILFAMTSAWYTNIVQTSGLMFQAEPWGFDGEILVDDTPIMAAPGDDGLVSLQIQNKSDSISAISVNVTKTGMADEMQQRLFFYVDTHMNRGGETMDRVYLNAYEGYTYTVFDQGWLTLTDTVSNAPQIKWEWVYDVLGYYVLAQRDTVVNLDGDEVDTMSIKEYLRPIEYDFDEATTVFGTDKDGKPTIEIKTVDGKVSMDTFLVQQSMKDGYAGTINVNNKLPDGYYPVEVDEDGYGVYAYLCSYGEIEVNTDWDTDLGKLAYAYAKDPTSLSEADKKKLSHEVTLSISAQKNETSTVSVSTLSALEEALVGSNADVIQLSSDIAIPAGSSLVVPANTRAMLDLNGKKITSSNAANIPAIDAKPGSSLTLTNGALEYEGEASGKVIGIQTVGAEVVMSNMTVNGFNYGINVADNATGNELDSRIHLMKCNVDAGVYAVFISGNGTNSQQKTQLIIENSTLRSKTITITGSGNKVQSGTDIQIINSSILNNVDAAGNDILTAGEIQVGAAIYHPQHDGTMTIQNSTVTGYTGIALKGGTIRIIDSQIKGNGDYTEPKEEKSGFTDTGDAIYVENTYAYEIGLYISGETTTVTHRSGEETQSLRLFGPNADTVFVQAEGGIFDEQLNSAWIAEGYEQSQNEDGKWVVTKQKTAAQ